MAEILPFCGVRYDASVVGDLNCVVSPPYDVIGTDLQAELYARSPFNMVRVDYGRDEADDEPGDNRYTRARGLLREWLRVGALRQDPEPSIYYTEETYQGEFGEPQVRKGFLSAVRLEDPESGLYRPHEKTLAGPKADRLQLMRASRANLSPIFSLYDSPTLELLEALGGHTRGAVPDAEVELSKGERTRMWRISEPAVIETVANGMRGRSFFIADGHHRYETALTYRNLMREATPGYSGREPWNYTLMYLTNLRAPGLTVFPTHRAVFGLEGLDREAFLREARAYFDVAEVEGGLPALQLAMRAAREGRTTIGVAARATGRLWRLTLRDPTVMERLLEGRAAPVLRGLDVTVLHTLVMEEILGINEKAQEEQRNLRYVKGSEELLRVVAEDEGVQLGFLLNPTLVSQVKAVAEEGERMPQKSTFFYPKLVTGLVGYPLLDLALGGPGPA